MSLRVPASLSEAEVERHYARDPTTGEIVGDDEIAMLAAAMASARAAAEQVAALADAAAVDRTRPPEAHTLAIRRAALAAGERGAAALDRARQRAAGVLARLDAETAAPAPPRDQGALQLEGEIRAKMDRLAQSARRAELDRALSTGDDLTMGAILRGPAFLSGLDRLEHDHLRLRFRHARHAEKAQRMDRLTAALEAADTGGRLLLGFVETAASGHAARQAEAQAGAVDAALARIHTSAAE